jgi:hypothetical protein
LAGIRASGNNQKSPVVVAYFKLELNFTLPPVHVNNETLRADISSIPGDEGRFIDEMAPMLDQEKIILAEYGITM